MTVTRRFLVAAAVLLVSACRQGPGPTGAPPTSPTATPTPTPSPTPPSGPPGVVAGPYTLSGTVHDEAGRSLAGVAVNLWVEQGSVGYSYWWAHGPVHTDAQGHYQLPGLSAQARVHFQASASGYFQQCAPPVITVTDSTTLDVGLVSAGSLSSSESSVPPSLPGYRIVTGTVYRATDQGNQPLAGASVQYEPLMDEWMAVTSTDGSGRFLLCGITSSEFANLGAYSGNNVANATVPPNQAQIDIVIR